jgi:hypothetical protein
MHAIGMSGKNVLVTSKNQWRKENQVVEIIVPDAKSKS